MLYNQVMLIRSALRSRIGEGGFTLIELLVVIAILAVLAVVVVLTLNPAGLLQESRDSNRVSDMATLNTALGLYTADATVASLGSANTVYVSMPDPTATSTAGDQCQGLGLISLPAGWNYQCAASSTFRKTDGTGWIPVNLSQASFGTPLSILPIDPTNTSSSRHYYAYATDGNGHFEVTSVMESAKYQLGGSGDVISTDGGTLATVYEKGTKLGLEPLDYGDSSLMGLWTFDEGAGTVAYDYSGNNATGSWSGTQAGTSGYYSAGQVGNWAGTFDGSTDKTTITTTGLYNAISQKASTVCFWVKLSGAGVSYTVLETPSFWDNGVDGFNIRLRDTSVDFQSQIPGPGIDHTYAFPSSIVGLWTHLVFTLDGSALRLYLNGSSVASWSTTSFLPTATTSIVFGEYTPAGNGFLSGSLDDVHIY